MSGSTDIVGSNLLRYRDDQQYLTVDTEAESLNLGFVRPFEASFATATLKGGISEVQTPTLLWKDLKMSADAARITKFDKAAYLTKAIDPRPVWYDQLRPKLLSKSYRIIWQNGLGFDVWALRNWAREVGDTSFNQYVIEDMLKRSLDIAMLYKAHKKKWPIDCSSPEAFLACQYRFHSHREVGFKFKLSVICKEFGIEFDEKVAHGAEYDSDRALQCAAKLIWALEIV